jgi:hypothetical protein
LALANHGKDPAAYDCLMEIVNAKKNKQGSGHIHNCMWRYWTRLWPRKLRQKSRRRLKSATKNRKRPPRLDRETFNHHSGFAVDMALEIK